MKSCLLLSLLCGALAVSAADAVPVEDVSKVSVPVEDVLKEEPDSEPHVQAAAFSYCPRGWHLYQENCFLFMNLSYTWNNADALCQSLGASLASAHDLREYSFLKQLTWRAGFLTAWIGGYRFQGFWKWDDGTSFDYNNWYQSSSYDCVFLNSQENTGWSSATCSNLHPFICSIKLNAC